MKNIFNKMQKYQKSMIWLLLVLNVMLAGGYISAINSTVFNVVASTKAEKSLARSSADAADLESKYVSLKNTINLDFAFAQGFKDASNQQVFITKKSTTNTLSFNAL